MTAMYEFWNNFNMNIKISYDWLLEYLDTDADPYEMQTYLSLCGPSIETVEKVGKDYVFDIEITSNRVDMASVYGIAQEAQAILPRFGKKAKLKELNPKAPKDSSNPFPIDITTKPHLTNRVLAIVLTDVKIGESPDYIKRRLELSGMRSLNNLVDITNYVMLETGHPCHVFDFDRIPTKKMMIRESKKGEKITSLENKTYALPGGDSVIDDGNGTIIDLPGIIGTSNSVVVDSTKNILFFIENNNPVKMRHSSMSLGIRTDAASLNEKGPDPERAFTAFLRGIELFQEVAHGQVTSKYLDIYPSPRTKTTIKVYLKDIHRIMGIIVDEEEIVSILSHLGFKANRHENPEIAYPDGVYFDITIPTWRVDDIKIKEDIVEEIARIYGYHNLPNNISPLVFVKQPPEVERLFAVQYKAKYFLKHIGLHECMNYSMISKNLIESMGMVLKDHLKLANTISQEIEYMRISLIPSLVKNIKENTGKRDVLRFFEIAKTYVPRKDDLPGEDYKLSIATNTDFADIKGVITSLFEDLKITDYQVVPGKDDMLAPGESAVILHNGKQVGIMGKLNAKIIQHMDLSGSVYVAEIVFDFIASQYTAIGRYTQPNQYAVVKLDATIEPQGASYHDIETTALKTSSLLERVEYIGSYQNNISLRFYFTSHKENISEKIAKKELEKILKAL